MSKDKDKEKAEKDRALRAARRAAKLSKSKEKKTGVLKDFLGRWH